MRSKEQSPTQVVLEPGVNAVQAYGGRVGLLQSSVDGSLLKHCGKHPMGMVLIRRHDLLVLEGCMGDRK